MSWDPTVLIIVIVINTLVGALIGQKKGRLEAGLIFGFLVGPIGWLVVALGPDHGPKCPECGGNVIEGANRCKNCGVELNTFDKQVDAMDFPEDPFSGS